MTTESPQQRAIAIVTFSLEGAYWTHAVTGAAQVLGCEKVTPTCFTLPPTRDGQAGELCHFYELVNTETVSGLMVVAPALLHDDATAFFRQRQHLPTVCVGQWIQGIPSLWIQNAAGIRLLMTHLAGTCDRRRIAFIRGNATNPEAEARYRAWQDYCAEHGLEHGSSLVERGNFGAQSGEAATLRLLERGPHPDAILACNDLMAVGVLRALQSQGIKVPDDMSVVGFDDLEAESTDPPLTTIRQPVYEMGQRAAELLLAQMCGKPVDTEHSVAPELVVRASCHATEYAVDGTRQGRALFVDTFLERTLPSPDSTFTALWDDLLGPQGKGTRPGRRVKLMARLDELLELSASRERAMFDAVKRTQSHAMRQIQRLLSSPENRQDWRSFLVEPLGLLGISELSVVKLKGGPCYSGEGQVVIDCTATLTEPITAHGTWLPSRQIVAALARRRGGTLRIMQPLLDGDRPLGFFAVSGALLDQTTLGELGTALLGVIQRQ